jgi:hypothetical protein
MRIKLALLLLCLSILIAGCHYPGRSIFPPEGYPVVTPSPFPQLTPGQPEPPLLAPTPNPDIDAIYTLQEGGPFYLPNFTHPDDGCRWLGVAGQIFDPEGLELLGLTVIAGRADDEPDNNLTAITGTAIAYGFGGYEIKLSNQAVDTATVYWVQVLDTGSEPLSQLIYFDTYADCERNLVLVNFVPAEGHPAP